MSDYTNYSKVRMEELKNDINTKKARYNELMESLTQKINEMHNYWVEGDQNAEAVYQQLLSQFNQFKANLSEGYEQMTKFESLVDQQIERYRQAESETLSAING